MDIKSLWQKLDQIAESTDHKSIPESKKKKPDADGDGVPDWADKKPGKDDNKDKKKIEEEVKDEYARKVDKYLKKKYNKEEVDMKGKKCTACKKGTYQETDQHDDMDGVLHCTKCNKQVKRHQSAKSTKKDVSESYTPSAGELARDLIKMSDSDFSEKYSMSKKQAEQHYSSSNLKEQNVSEDRGFRGVGGAREREDDERHDLDPSDWYIVKDGKLLKASIYPRQEAQARAEGFSPTREEARSKASNKGVSEDAPELKNVKHFAKPGGYGRKIDKDDESGDAFHSSDIDDTDDAPAAKAPVKRGRGRPMKGGDSETGITKKYDTDTLSSWIIGNKPKNIGKIGKVSHVNRLKEYMEMVERKTIVEGYIAEGRMSELSMIVDDIIDGRLDIYDIISGKYTPTSDLEDFVQQTLKKSYEETARDHGLHADDDGDEIIGIMYNDIHDIMSNALNKGIDEQAQPMPAQAASQQAGQQTQQTQQLPVLAGGKPVGSAPTAQAVQAATPMVNDILNKKQALGKMGVSVTALEESLADTMNRFSSILNESNGRRTVGRRTLSESKTPKLVLEGTLEEIIAVHPHEHKMCQEGWGMDESLYEALCDHYHKEGRIPRKVWHGSSEDLRKCVEECYMEDTQSLMGESTVRRADVPGSEDFSTYSKKEMDALFTIPSSIQVYDNPPAASSTTTTPTTTTPTTTPTTGSTTPTTTSTTSSTMEEDDDNHEVAAGLGGLALGGGLGYAAGSGALDGIVGSAMGLMGLEEDDLDEGVNDLDELRDKIEWLMTTYHLRYREAEETAYYDDEPETWKGSPWENEYGMEEGFAGGALGGLAGAALTKSPSGALAGAKFGSDIQDSFGKKSPFENEEMDLRRHAMTRLIDELDESTYGTLKTDMSESKKPSAGMTKGEKSSLVKKAKSGKDIGKPGKGFDKLAKKAGEKYGSAEKGKKVAAAAMWKNAAPTNEGEEQLDELSKDTLGSYVKKASKDVEGKAGEKQQYKDMFAGNYPVRGAKKEVAKKQEKINKRQVGIGKAVDKMTNEATDDDYDKAAILKGKRGRDARDDPAKAVAAAKRSPAAQDARAKLDKVSQYGNKVKESAKPDFLDVDKDGNKKESFKKAIVDKKKDVEESMDQPMSKILAKGYTSSQEHGDKSPRMSAKEKAAAKVARDARDAADMKAFYAKSDAKKKVKENVNVAQMQAGTFRPGDKAIARDGSQVTIAKVEGNGDVWIKSWQDDKPQRVDARTLKSVGSSGKALAESYDFSEWDNQLSSLLKPTPKQAVSESAKIKKQMINESSNELSTMLQFAGLKNVQQVMEEFNASIYADDSESTSSTDGADNPPQLAMPTGMGMSQQKEDDDESTVVEPMMSDEVIGGLAKGDKESTQSDNDHLSFFKKMLSHGQSEVKTEKPKSESGEQSGIPASTSQSPVSGETSDKPVTEASPVTSIINKFKPKITSPVTSNKFKTVSKITPGGIPPQPAATTSTIPTSSTSTIPTSSTLDQDPQAIEKNAANKMDALDSNWRNNFSSSTPSTSSSTQQAADMADFKALTGVGEPGMTPADTMPVGSKYDAADMADFKALTGVGEPGMTPADTMKKLSTPEINGPNGTGGPLEEEDMEEGNEFTGALAKARSNGVQKGETMKVDGKTYPVKEDSVVAGNGDNEEEQSEVSSDATRDAALAQNYTAEDEHQGMASDSIIGDILAKLTQLVGSEQGQPAMSAEPPVMVDVQYADDEQSQDYADEESQDEEQCDQCQSCGGAMYENHQCMESLNEWANSPTGESADEQFQTDMDFMTKVISGGLNNQKQDQTTLPSTRVVTRDESKDVSNTMGAMLRKLSGIN